MRGRLTLEKVNAAINEMAIYADVNAQLIAAPKKKVGAVFFIQFSTTVWFDLAVVLIDFIYGLQLSEDTLERALVNSLLLIYL